MNYWISDTHSHPYLFGDTSAGVLRAFYIATLLPLITLSFLEGFCEVLLVDGERQPKKGQG